MHPRNRYKDCPPDLEALAASNAALRTYINPLTKALEVSKPGAVAELVKTLIRVDFKVESYSGVPEGYLVPSVTRSLNYLHFVEDLIGEARAKGLTHSVLQRRLQPSQKRIREAQDDDSSATLITVRGLDVGFFFKKKYHGYVDTYSTTRYPTVVAYSLPCLCALRIMILRAVRCAFERIP